MTIMGIQSDLKGTCGWIGSWRMVLICLALEGFLRMVNAASGLLHHPVDRPRSSTHTSFPFHLNSEATAKLVEYEKALARGSEQDGMQQGQGRGNRASISFRAGVELFFRYVTRNNDESPVCEYSACSIRFVGDWRVLEVGWLVGFSADAGLAVCWR